MSENPFEDPESLFQELMKRGKGGLRDSGVSKFEVAEGLPELGSGVNAIPLDGLDLDEDDIQKLTEAANSSDIEGIMGILGLSPDILKLFAMIVDLADSMNDAAKIHSTIMVMDPDHECHVLDGTLGNERDEDSPDFDWTEMHGQSFALVEANILGLYMGLRTELVTNGIELPVYPTFPDVPAYAFAGEPPEAMQRVNLSTCETCGEYSLLCEGHDDETEE